MSNNPLPLPTVKQVVAAAEAIGIIPEPQLTTTQPTTVDVNTAAGQTHIPSVVGSQPSSNKSVDKQFQTSVESIPLDELFLRPLTEDEILHSPLIQARSFNYSGDEIKVKPINHNYVLRWVQCGDYKGSGTNWLAKQIARGFEYATTLDLQEEYREKFKKDSLGHFVIPPDLVLMKIQAHVYYGYLKNNMIESLDRISDKGVLKRAENIASKQMRGEALPGELKEHAVGVAGSPSSPKSDFRNSLVRDKAAFYDPLAGR